MNPWISCLSVSSLLGVCVWLGGPLPMASARAQSADVASNPDVAGLIERLRMAFLSEAAGVRRAAVAADAQLLSQYGDAVAKFARDSQAQGEFEAWQAGTRERERFEKVQSLTAVDVQSAPEGLRALQQRALEARIEVRRKAARETVELANRLVARLESMKRELTIRGDAAGAQLSIDAIAKARADEVYSDALFSLEANEPFPVAERQPTPPSPVDAPTAEGAPPTTGARPKPAKPEITTSHGVRVSAPDVAPVQPPGTRLCILKPTDAAPKGGAPVAVSARYLMRDQLSFRMDGQDVTANVMDVQVAIKAHADVQRVDGLIVVVEYFAGRTKGAPFPVQFTAVNLAAVDTRTLYIQMPPTSYQVQTVPSALGGTRRYVDKTLQFRGLVVTVFDLAGEILQQSVSHVALAPLAGDITRFNANGTLNYP